MEHRISEFARDLRAPQRSTRFLIDKINDFVTDMQELIVKRNQAFENAGIVVSGSPGFLPADFPDEQKRLNIAMQNVMQSLTILGPLLRDSDFMHAWESISTLGL